VLRKRNKARSLNVVALRRRGAALLVASGVFIGTASSSERGALAQYQPANVLPCGVPPPIPTPFVAMDTPINGTSDVSPKLRSISVAAEQYGLFVLVSASQITALPVIRDIPPHNNRYPSTLLLRLPHLKRSTAYVVNHLYPDWTDALPCFTQASQMVGTFKTSR